jgi:hypothetical protein
MSHVRKGALWPCLTSGCSGTFVAGDWDALWYCARCRSRWLHRVRVRIEQWLDRWAFSIDEARIAWRKRTPR